MSSYRVLLLIITALILTTGLVIGCSSSDDSNTRTDQAAVEEPADNPTAEPAQDPVEPVEPVEPIDAAEPEQPAEPAQTSEPEQPEEPPASPEPDAPDATPEPIDPIEPATPAYDEPTIPPTPVKPADPPAPMVERSLGSVRVDAPKDGLTDVGVERCMKCHKIQYTSWLETEHAKLEPPLDCEACHGPGSEYRSLKVMKDPEASRAAGLVDPSPTFCARCHVSGWDDEMIERAHAHKESGTE